MPTYVAFSPHRRCVIVATHVVQNGEAPVPNGTPQEINGYEVDGATQFLFVNFEETLRALRKRNQVDGETVRLAHEAFRK